MLPPKPIRLKGSGLQDDAKEMKEIAGQVVAAGKKAGKAVRKTGKKVGKKARKAVSKAKELVKEGVEEVKAAAPKVVDYLAKQHRVGQEGQQKLIDKFNSMHVVKKGIKLLHSHEHAIRVAENLGPTAFAHLKHSASLVHEKLTGGGLAHDIMHRDHTVSDLKDFAFRYGKVPLGALKDIVKSISPIQLAKGLKNELYDRHFNKWKGAGLWQAMGTSQDAMVHTSKKVYGKAAKVYHRIKREAPEHLEKVDAWLQHVVHANHHVAEHIHKVNNAAKRVKSYMMTSGLPPEVSAVGEKLGDVAGHVHHQSMHLTKQVGKFGREHVQKLRKSFGAGIDFGRWQEYGDLARKTGRTVGKAAAAGGAATIAAGAAVTAGGAAGVGVPLVGIGAAVGGAGWALNQGLRKNTSFAF